jgi:4-hydroxybenzoate polyprenyltransferase
MKGLAVFVWIASVMAALFFAPSITAITTIAIVTMLLCAVLVLVEIRDALTRPAPSGQVGMFSSKSEES